MSEKKMSRQEIDQFARQTSLVIADIGKMTAHAMINSKNPRRTGEKIKKILSDAYEKVKKEVENEGKGAEETLTTAAGK